MHVIWKDQAVCRPSGLLDCTRQSRSFLHGHLAAYDFVSRLSLDHGRSRKLCPALWTCKVPLCVILNNAGVPTLDERPLACLWVQKINDLSCGQVKAAIITTKAMLECNETPGCRFISSSIHMLCWLACTSARFSGQWHRQYCALFPARNSALTSQS